jgi:hypothetical protein
MAAIIDGRAASEQRIVTRRWLSGCGIATLPWKR